LPLNDFLFIRFLAGLYLLGGVKSLFLPVMQFFAEIHI